MELESGSGYYWPGFLHTQLGIGMPLDELDTWGAEALLLLFHEYLHYIQDTTTVFGINNTWNTLDQLSTLISRAHADKEIVVPFDFQLGDILTINRELQKIAYGHKKPVGLNWDIDREDNREPLAISAVLPIKNELLSDQTHDSSMFIPRVVFHNHDPETVFFDVGYIGISETMVYLIERKYSTELNLSAYPYLSAKEIALFLHPSTGERDDLLITACELSLMTTFPGNFFYTLLCAAASQHRNFDTPHELYNFGMDLLVSKYGSIEKWLDTSKNGLIKKIGEIFNNKAFNNERQWISYVFEKGVSIRKNDPLIFLNIYYTRQPFSSYVQYLRYMLGSPNTVDLWNNTWFDPPYELKANESAISPTRSAALKAVTNFLVTGDPNCMLRSLCYSFEPNPVEDVCSTAPWQKANRDQLCPFGAFWKGHLLDRYPVRYR